MHGAVPSLFAPRRIVTATFGVVDAFHDVPRLIVSGMVDRLADLVLAAGGGLDEMTSVKDGGAKGVKAGHDEVRTLGHRCSVGASLESGSVPNYRSLTPDQRDRWKAHLAQRFDKPKSEVSPADWDRAND